MNRLTLRDWIELKGLRRGVCSIGDDDDNDNNEENDNNNEEEEEEEEKKKKKDEQNIHLFQTYRCPH
jgi:ABC-type Zn2+ transport system substrate-binding protein/surface adhesin